MSCLISMHAMFVIYHKRLSCACNNEVWIGYSARANPHSNNMLPANWKKEYLKQDVQDYKTEFKLRSEYDVSFLILLGL